MAKNTCGISKLQANRLYETLLDRRKKKTTHLQIVSVLIFLIQNIAFSSLNFFQQPRKIFLKVREVQNWRNGKLCVLEKNWSKSHHILVLSYPPPTHTHTRFS